MSDCRAALMAAAPVAEHSSCFCHCHLTIFQFGHNVVKPLCAIAEIFELPVCKRKIRKENVKIKNEFLAGTSKLFLPLQFNDFSVRTQRSETALHNNGDF